MGKTDKTDKTICLQTLTRSTTILAIATFAALFEESPSRMVDKELGLVLENLGALIQQLLCSKGSTLQDKSLHSFKPVNTMIRLFCTTVFDEELKVA